MIWGSPVEIERRNRIMVSLWAYAYEVMDESLVDDFQYDEMCRKINPSIETGRLDEFFKNEFSPDTGIWIYKHPEPDLLINFYHRFTGKLGKSILPPKNDSPPVTREVSNMGFKTQTEMKWYIASLGFSVVPHWGEHAGRFCKTEFDKDCGYITDINTGEQITILYKDLFGACGSVAQK